MAVMAVLLIAFPFLVQRTFPIHVMITVFIFAILGVSWNITGSAGLVSLGHTFFYGVAGYIAATLAYHFGINPWIGLLIAMLVNGLLALLIGNLLAKVYNQYFAIATIALAELARAIVINWPAVGGSVGLFLPYTTEDSLVRFQFMTDRVPYYFIIFTLFILVILFNNYIFKTRFGFYLKAMKGNRDAALSLGINIKGLKRTAIVAGAVIAAIPGPFMAQYTFYLSHETFFAFQTSVYALLVVVLGGIGTLWGPFVGALVLIPLSEFFRVAFGGTGRATDLVIFGFLMMIMAIYQPRGILGMKVFQKREKGGAGISTGVQE
jgi:branched-chain amino acid transport system permease protein